MNQKVFGKIYSNKKKLYLINKKDKINLIIYRYTSRLRTENKNLINSLIFNQQTENETIIYTFIVEIPKNFIINLTKIKKTNKVSLFFLLKYVKKIN